ncbi:MAG: hypothetical protein HC884_13570 [Chloroflexaceae bacterium]|nr:hypothetical protein [Chloroflexaceae bacterium]
MPTLVAYDELCAAELVRFWTPQQLREALEQEHFGSVLDAAEADELARLLHEWMQRAMGQVTLRDALLVDPRRGERVYSLICTTLTVEHCPLLPEVGEALKPLNGKVLSPGEVREALEQWRKQPATRDPNDRPYGHSHHHHTLTTHLAALYAVLQRAEARGLSVVQYEGEQASYPFPANLDALLPPMPVPYAESEPRFEPPTGWRRILAIILVLLGVALLGVPLLMGQVPAQTAGLPLGLLTLGLLVGIHAGWAGYCGGVCIWLVANLPSFHYDRFTLWPAVPLMLVGLTFLWLDRNVRILVRWIWQRRWYGR